MGFLKGVLAPEDEPEPELLDLLEIRLYHSSQSLSPMTALP